jgi:hypothetical protein
MFDLNQLDELSDIVLLNEWKKMGHCFHVLSNSSGRIESHLIIMLNKSQ